MSCVATPFAIPTPLRSNSSMHMQWRRQPWAIVLSVAWCFMGVATLKAEALIVSAEFIFESAPFKSCHASTIVQTANGLTAAWFAGSEEGDKDVGIWMSMQRDGRWSAPVEVANGAQKDGSRLPC